MRIDEVLGAGAPPVIAILRGVRPEEAVAIGSALMDAGVRMIEVPFNSPEPLSSIRALQDAFGSDAAIGGGTVLDEASAAALAATGGTMLIAPNTDERVIARGIALGLDALPGFTTPSEAFRAVAAGARRIKLFPAVALGPAYLRALREVLPREAEIWAVGGTGADNLGDWLEAGAAGIGVGGSLYRPGQTAAEVGAKASALVAAWRRARPA